MRFLSNNILGAEGLDTSAYDALQDHEKSVVRDPVNTVIKRTIEAILGASSDRRSGCVVVVLEQDREKDITMQTLMGGPMADEDAARLRQWLRERLQEMHDKLEGEDE